MPVLSPRVGLCNGDNYTMTSLLDSNQMVYLSPDGGGYDAKIKANSGGILKLDDGCSIFDVNAQRYLAYNPFLAKEKIQAAKEGAIFSQIYWNITVPPQTDVNFGKAFLFQALLELGKTTKLLTMTGDGDLILSDENITDSGGISETQFFNLNKLTM